MIILFSCSFKKSLQLGIFDMFELYDGVQCSIEIVQLFLVNYNQPICCIYWKVKNFFEKQAISKCDTPENVQKLLSGEVIKDYVDFSQLNCSRYPEDSPDCDRLWSIVLTVLIGQIVLFFLFFLATIFLTCWLCRLRRYRQNEKLMKAKLMMNDMETSSLTISDQFEDSDSEMTANHSSMRYLIDSINRNIITINDYNPIKQQYDSDTDDRIIIANKTMTVNMANNLFIDENDDDKKIKEEKNIENYQTITAAANIQGNAFMPFVLNSPSPVYHSTSNDNDIYNKVNDQIKNDMDDFDDPAAKTNKQFDSMEDFV